MTSNLNAPSTNSLFGGDSASIPVGQHKKGGAPNVVADDADDDDDWGDNEDTAS